MRLLGSLALALLLTGCSDGPLTSLDADVSGTWQGPLTFSGQRQTLRLSLFQNKIDLSGNWVIGDNGGSLGGQVSGSAVLLTLREASTCQLNITASVTESRMIGSFAFSTTGCGGDTSGGSIDLTKVR